MSYRRNPLCGSAAYGVVVACVAIFPGAVSAAGRAQLVKDIVTAERGSDPRDFAELDGVLYFVARDGKLGEELWKSDGTSSGTVRVKLLGRSRSLGTSYKMTPVGHLIFFAVGSSTGVLWRSDGTSAGTFPLGFFSLWTDFVDVDGVLFFGTYDTDGPALWRSNGSETGTLRVRALDRLPEHLTAVGNTLFFKGGIGELWRSNGSESGTFRVKEVGLGERDLAAPFDLFDVDGTLYFFTNGEQGRQLWSSDGAEAGTVLVSEPVHYEGRGSGVGPRGAVRGTLVFPGGDPVHGIEPWRSDGTPEGTMMIADLNPGAASSRPGSFKTIGDLVFFTASDASGHGLWVSDLTEPGTALLNRTIDRKVNWGIECVSAGDELFFSRVCRDSDCSGRQLWVTDGSADGTRMVRSFQEIEYGLTVAGDRVFLPVTTTGIGRELWTSDGTALGTVLLKNINLGTRESYRRFQSGSMAGLGNSLFFTVDDPESGPPGFYDVTDIWRTDGTDAGTIRISGHDPLGPATPTDLTTVGNQLLFFAGALSQQQLWAMDGNGEELTLLGEWTSLSRSPALLGDILYFAAADEASGMELWRSDGTPEGTTLVRDIHPGPEGLGPRWITRVGDQLYFTTGSFRTEQTLWTSDGSGPGTVSVKQFPPETASLELLTAVGRRLFFFTSGSLWVSDGTASGTREVGEFVDEWIDDGYRPPTPNRPSELTDVDGTLFFVADDGQYGRELWKSDGTATGTTLVKNILPGRESRFTGPRELTSLVGMLIFVADDGETGPEIWRSDGTEAGTVLVQDSSPGSSRVWASGLTAVNDLVVFTTYADDGTADDGTRLWRTDGTDSGTFALRGARAAPFSRLSLFAPLSPPFSVAGSGIYFFADDHVHGVELWTMPAEALDARACAGDCADDGDVEVHELVMAVNIALGLTPLRRCEPSDCDGDGQIRIEELMSGVQNASMGCP